MVQVSSEPLTSSNAVDQPEQQQQPQDNASQLQLPPQPGHDSDSSSRSAVTVVMHLVASLLQLRGSSSGTCPLVDPKDGNVLVFNGEVFGGLEVPRGANDGAVLLEALAAPGGEPREGM